jgi:hypothetical protein
MLKNARSICRLWLSGAAMSLAAAGIAASAARAAEPSLDAFLEQLQQSRETATYSRVATIKIPGQPLSAFDISFVDPRLPFYYLADRSNAALDIIDTRSNAVVGQVGGFVGVRTDPATGKTSTDISGPDGVQVVGLGEVWVGDGDSSVKVVDVLSQKVVATISTALDGQTADQDKRADEMSYDPRDQVLVVANNAAVPPYITMISTQPSDRRVLGHIIYGNAAGVEQSVYNPANGLFYVNLTQVGDDPNSGAVSIVDPRRMVEIGRFPVTGCNGAGLALAPGQKLLVGCSLTNNSQIISARDGSLLAEIPQISGSDEVWYNPGDGRFYLAGRNNPTAAGGPSLGVIDAFTNQFVTNVPTDASAHSVAADRRTNNVFVPLGPIANDPECSAGCIAVYNALKNEGSGRGVERFLSDLSGLK